MALTPSTLRLVSVGDNKGKNLWFYSTADNITDLDVNDYWASGAGVRQVLTAGDLILATCANGGVCLYVTSASATASVVAIFA